MPIFVKKRVKSAPLVGFKIGIAIGFEPMAGQITRLATMTLFQK
jgi:hypothetical protein